MARSLWPCKPCATEPSISFPSPSVHRRSWSGFTKPWRSIRTTAANVAHAAEVQLRWNKLTDREREISLLLATGETPKHIALHLSISPKTVDNHQTRILAKMNVENPTQLAHLLAALE